MIRDAVFATLVSALVAGQGAAFLCRPACDAMASVHDQTSEPAACHHSGPVAALSISGNSACLLLNLSTPAIIREDAHRVASAGTGAPMATAVSYDAPRMLPESATDLGRAASLTPGSRSRTTVLRI